MTIRPHLFLCSLVKGGFEEGTIHLVVCRYKYECVVICAYAPLTLCVDLVFFLSIVTIVLRFICNIQE